MSSIDDLRKLTTPPPTGWEPGAEWNGNSGHVTTPPMAAGEADIIVAKHRGGSTGTIPLAHELHMSRFRNPLSF